MITERENALRMILRTGNPEWIPRTSECYTTIIPSAVLERPQGGSDGLDWFGCQWVFDGASRGYAQDPRNGFPVEDITTWRSKVSFPDLDQIDWEAAAKKDLAEYDRTQTLLRIFLESGPFERLHSLTSFESAFIAMYEEPEAFVEMMDALTTFRIELIRKLYKYYRPDIIFTMDDLGSVSAPLMSLDMYRQFIKPSHIRLGSAIHELNMFYCQHSCGNMDSFVGDLIEAGVDIIQPLQGNCNDQRTVLEKYGHQVSFDGGLALMTSRPESTETELRQEVRRVCDLFGPYKNYIIHDVSLVPENLAIVRDEANKYGRAFYLSSKADEPLAARTPRRS